MTDQPDEEERYQLVRFWVLRLLGLVYLVAFLGAARQGPGLIGASGLLPMQGFLERVREAFGGSLLQAMAELPTLFWIDASDVSFAAVAWLGVALSACVLCGVTNALVQLALWAGYLSIAQVGQIFWAYGWESQLLETGAISVFMCPLRSLRPFGAPPPKVTVWLLRWLIARVMLGAGLIKLRGDACWIDLTCLDTHFETQPIPNPLSPWFHFAPAWTHQLGVLSNHLIEVLAPCFAFGPRAARRIAGASFVLLQAVLILSGNLSFLNWLTLVPALACFDDRLLGRLTPHWLIARAQQAPDTGGLWARRAALAYAALVGLLSIQPTLNLLSPGQAMNRSYDPLRLVNTYGAFGSVSRERYELVIEGTRDAVVTPATRFEPYPFVCKPGDVTRTPCWISPYHLRLDWQMWFGALGSPSTQAWLLPLLRELLAGNPAVERLLAERPFDGAPPRHLRVRYFRYELLPPWAEGDAVWRREWVRDVIGPVSLADLRR